MGNCFTVCKSSKQSCISVKTAKHQKVLRVVKMDGKMLEFTAPILVKNLLVDYSGSGVGVSKEASHHLPPNYELKLGRSYYLLPITGSVSASSPACVSSMNGTEQNGVVKRIKVVITKKQLEELLSKQISAGDVLSELERETCPIDSSSCWKPKLESIPEGNE
ncbi:uncharacterized protein LOC132270161 [Cornus florida]|uniref:uncharacterized protein LOC132270161 n=1 Tax=Cornus florida TaxID=4283 RepID=UPI002897CC10|nr:uncharacterized protein LOC132270161 [Cornus florida]